MRNRVLGDELRPPHETPNPLRTDNNASFVQHTYASCLSTNYYGGQFTWAAGLLNERLSPSSDRKLDLTANAYGISLAESGATSRQLCELGCNQLLPAIERGLIDRLNPLVPEAIEERW